jgi:hypothetical protein
MFSFVQSKTISFRHRRPLLYATTWAWLCRPGCVVAWTWAHDMVLQLMLPLLVGLINLLEYMINSVLHPAQYPSLVKHRRAAVISKYLAFINCLYMTLVRYTVGAFVCINLAADGSLMVLKADPNIECYSPTHNALMAVAAVGVVLYTVGYARPTSGHYCLSGSLWHTSSFSFLVVTVVALSLIDKRQEHNSALRIRQFGDLYDR